MTTIDIIKMIDIIKTMMVDGVSVTSLIVVIVTYALAIDGNISVHVLMSKLYIATIMAAGASVTNAAVDKGII